MNYWLLVILTISLLFISNRIYFNFLQYKYENENTKMIIFFLLNFQLAFILPIYLYSIDPNLIYENSNSQLFSTHVLIWFFIGNIVSSFYIFKINKEILKLENMALLDTIFYIIMNQLVIILFWPIFLVFSLFLYKKL